MKTPRTTKEQNKVAAIIQKAIDDKAYIKEQIQAGESIDHSKLKAGKIEKISL